MYQTYRFGAFIMGHATLSTSLDEKAATRLRLIAKREGRSTSGIIASAVALMMPKELREALRLFAAEDPRFLADVLNEMTALAVERKFDLARRLVSESSEPVPGLDGASEADLAEMALALAAH
jgi:hypothetical protein